MKKILFLDWHNTITSEKFFESLHNSNNPKIKKHAKDIEKLIFVDNKEYSIKWMKGEIKSEEVIEYICTTLNINYDWLWNIFVSDCKRMSLENGIKEKLMSLRKYYTLVLITGNMDCFNRFTIPYQKLGNLFDIIVNSSDLGYLKTDFKGKAFSDIIQANATTAFQCYLIDDSLAACDVFSNIGGFAINIKKIKTVPKKLDELIVHGPYLKLPL